MDESTIYKKLYDFFKPEILKVINDSEKHKGHSGSPNSGNSHFSITIKSKKLNGLTRVSGQRAIYKVLEEGNQSMNWIKQYKEGLSIEDIMKCTIREMIKTEEESI